MFRYGNNNSFNNHTGYVGNSHFNDNSGSITAAQFRALIVINCKNASFQIAQEEHQLDSGKGGKQYHRVYHEPNAAGFFNIYPGEICFESTALPHRNYDQQPYARACLNNQFITADEKASKKPIANMMKRNIRIIGLAIKPYIWNEAIAAHSPDPVIIASGLSSAYNSGKENIEAGQTVIASFPDTDHRNHYNQSSAEKSLNIPDKRVIFETKPLTKINDVLDPCDIHDITGIKHFARVVNLIVRENLAQQLGRVAAGSSKPVATVITDFMNSIKRGSNTSTNPGEPKEVEECRTASEMDDLMKLIVPMPFDGCTPDHAPDWLTEFFRELLVVCSAVSSHSSSRVLGVAQTSARNKKLFDIISTPTMESGVARLLTTMYYEQTVPPVGGGDLVVALRPYVAKKGVI